MKLSTIIKRAANEYLSADSLGPLARMSCIAVWDALGERETGTFQHLVLEMGLGPVDNFDEFPAGEVRQSVRYAWLMLVAQVADEEGITV